MTLLYYLFSGSWNFSSRSHSKHVRCPGGRADGFWPMMMTEVGCDKARGTVQTLMWRVYASDRMTKARGQVIWDQLVPICWNVEGPK